MTEENQSMLLKEATEQDYDVAKEIIVGSFSPRTWYRTIVGLHGSFNGLGWENLWDMRFSDAFSSSHCVLGNWRGETVGCALFSIHPQTGICHLDLLAIRPERQRQGLGSLFLEATCEHVKSLGANSVMLVCDSKNERANLLYERSRFVEVNRTVRWFRSL
jgi:ribosomal protein S18 acetylase RimI-like enzyme